MTVESQVVVIERWPRRVVRLIARRRIVHAASEPAQWYFRKLLASRGSVVESASVRGLFIKR